MMRCESQQHSDSRHYRSQADMPAELRERLFRCAIDYGETYAAYLATEADREYFWSQDGQGVLGFRRRGRYVTVADGLLAAPVDREGLLTDFLAFAASRRWHVSFLNVPRTELNLFRRHGCEVSKCGEEPLVRLQRTRWQGSDWAWVRRQENYCQRQGVTFREVSPDPLDAAYCSDVAPQLDDISQSHIAGTLHRRELQFFVSQFSPLDLRDRRLFVAEHEGRIVAFIVCNPGLRRKLWAVEVYRRRVDAPRGVIPALIMHAMRQMQAEGVEYVSLSLAPFLRCTPVTGDSSMFRTIANFWWRRLNAIYDVQGLFHFKSRFRPDYREMYLAAMPKITVRSLWSMAMTWQLFHVNPLRLAVHSWRHGAAAERRSLAMPSRGVDRIIRELRTAPASAATLSVDAPSPVPALAPDLSPHEVVPA
jgi:phosphatidylglycerol lysyltransferase